MKLLLDENLSPWLVESLSDLDPASEHVDRVGLGGVDDGDVWNYAKVHGFAIVSKDSDFAERSMLRVSRRISSGFGWETAQPVMLRNCCDHNLRRCEGFLRKIKRLVCCLGAVSALA